MDESPAPAGFSRFWLPILATNLESGRSAAQFPRASGPSADPLRPDSGSGLQSARHGWNSQTTATPPLPRKRERRFRLTAVPPGPILNPDDRRGGVLRMQAAEVGMTRTTALVVGALLMALAVTSEASGGSGRASCPVSVAGVKPTNNPTGFSALVPPRPTGLILCRYTGLNDQPPMTLARTVRIKQRSRMRDLGRKLDALPAPPAGTYSCPNDDGSAIAARFSYKNDSPVTVVVHLGGCGAVTNGRVRRTSMHAESLIKRLKSLTG